MISLLPTAASQTYIARILGGPNGDLWVTQIGNYWGDSVAKLSTAGLSVDIFSVRTSAAVTPPKMPSAAETLRMPPEPAPPNRIAPPLVLGRAIAGAAYGVWRGPPTPSIFLSLPAFSERVRAIPAS